MVRYLNYGIIFSLTVNLITIISPILLLSGLSRIPLFGIVVIFYLPVAFLLIYPALLVSLICAVYSGLQIFKAQNSSFFRLMVVSVLSLFLNIIALYLRHLMSLSGKNM